MMWNDWNDFSEAIALALSTLFVLMPAYVTFNIQHKQNTLNFLAAVAFTLGVLIFLFNVEYQFIKYISYWSSYAIFHVTITISRYRIQFKQFFLASDIWLLYFCYFCSAEIAKGVLHGRYGLIFGLNKFLVIAVYIILLKIFGPHGSYALGEIMAFVGFAYILFMFICNVKTSNPGIVLSTAPPRNNNEQTMNIENGPVENSSGGNNETNSSGFGQIYRIFRILPNLLDLNEFDHNWLFKFLEVGFGRS